MSSTWSTFQSIFSTIINRYSTYNTLLEEISDTPHNILIHCVYGFPIDLFIDEVIKHRFGIETASIYKTNAVWGKNIPYIENQHFFEINMMNPDIPKDLSFLTDMILEIIKTKNVNDTKHFVIIKHIELLKELFFDFRILLERYSNNVTFLCFTHSISQIEMPIRSRFNIFRVPLFTNEQIHEIFKDYLCLQVPKFFPRNSRDILHVIFLSDVEHHEPLLITDSFCKYKFPPLYDFVIAYDAKKENLENIRTLSYKCCQYNVSVKDLVQDFLLLLEETTLLEKISYQRILKKQYETYKNNMKCYVIRYGADIDHKLCQTNKGREPIYIEAFLCDVFLNPDKKST